MKTIINSDVKNSPNIPDERMPEKDADIPIDENDNVEGNPHKIEDRPSIRFYSLLARSKRL
jgi:hypothetical protein